MNDPFYDPYGPREKPVYRLMISISGLWRYFTKKKNKKKLVRREK